MGVAVLTGLVLLTGAGCSSGPIWVGAASSNGVSSAAGPPGTSGRGGTTGPGGGHGGKADGRKPGGSGGAGAGQGGGSPGSSPGGPSGVTPGGPGGSGRAVLFGGDVPLTAEETQLGRTLAIVRGYDLIGQHFPDRREERFMSQGSTILISFDTYPRHGPSYADIAAGREDGTIRAFLESVEQAAVKDRLGAISEVPHCNYEINNDSSSLAALASMGHATDMQGR